MPWATRASPAFVRFQPCSQSRANLDMATASCLTRSCSDFDEPALEIDLRPIQALQLGDTHPGKSANRPVRQSATASVTQQKGELFGREDSHIGADDLGSG